MKPLLADARRTISLPSAPSALETNADHNPEPRMSNANSRVLAFVSVPESHPLRRLRPFGCPGLDDSPGQAPLTPPSPLKVSNPLCPGGGRGARSAPLSAPTRPPSPIFAGNVNISSLRSKTNQVERSAVAPLRRAVARPTPRAPRSQTAAPWRAGGSLYRCSLQSAGQHSSPDGHLADSAASATPPQSQRQPLRFRRPRPAPPPGADNAPSRPWTRSQPEGPPGKRPAFHSAVARRLARPCVAP